jgi:putative transposase
MMSYRDYKQFAAGEVFHIYNRGNGKADIFRDDRDYQNFLKRLSIILRMEELTSVSKAAFDSRVRLTPFSPETFSLICYCLMPNHFHFCIMQHTEIPIGTLIHRLCTSYAKYFNRKYGHVGHIFQDRFKAVRVEADTQLLALSAYIHQNPKIAKLVIELKDWPYSSYQEYRTGQRRFCEHGWLFQFFEKTNDYETFVEDRYSEILKRKIILDQLSD